MKCFVFRVFTAGTQPL